MKNIGIFFMVCLMAAAAQAQPQLIDDFADTDLSQYTKSIVLEQNGTADVSFASPSGVLQVSRSDPGYNAEQVLFLRDEDLSVGKILRVDTARADSTIYADFGIAVCNMVDPPDAVWTSGTEDARAGYLAVYMKPLYDSIGWAGFDDDGTDVGHSSGIGITWSDLIGLYIMRKGTSEFQGGYITKGGGGIYNPVQDWTVTSTTIGDAIGFYTDLRSTVTYGDLDNLTIVPEPATLVLLGIGSVLTLRRRKR